MAGICPMCGAPMEKNVCEYCGYEQEIPKQETYTYAASHGVNQNFSQPNVVINNQTVYGSYTSETVSGKSKVIAFILCFFLGPFGAHQFYVGKTGWGIVYFFTAGLFGIGCLVDLILILMGKFKDKNGLLLSR